MSASTVSVLKALVLMLKTSVRLCHTVKTDHESRISPLRKTDNGISYIL